MNWTLSLWLGWSAVEALHALSIALACIQISITDATHKETTNLWMQFSAVHDGLLCCANPPARFPVSAAQLHDETRYVMLRAHLIEMCCSLTGLLIVCSQMTVKIPTVCEWLTPTTRRSPPHLVLSLCTNPQQDLPFSIDSIKAWSCNKELLMSLSSIRTQQVRYIS